MLKLINITFITVCLLFYLGVFVFYLYWNSLSKVDQCFIKRQIDTRIVEYQMKKNFPDTYVHSNYIDGLFKDFDYEYCKDEK